MRMENLPIDGGLKTQTHVNQVVVGGLFGGVEGLWLLGPAGGPRLPLLGCEATENSCNNAGALFTFEANARCNAASVRRKLPGRHADL